MVKDYVQNGVLIFFIIVTNKITKVYNLPISSYIEDLLIFLRKYDI